MRYRTALSSSLVIVSSVLLSAQRQEFVRLLRNGDQAMLTAYGPRPVDLAAQKLVEEFGVAINVEDPVYIYRGDLQDVTPPHLAGSGYRRVIPKYARLELRFELQPDGSLLDVRKVMRDLVDRANARLPFGYRIDDDGDVFTLVPTRTRDEQGRTVGLTPLLDRRVTIPLGRRRIFEHVNLLTQALEQQTGFRISCCQGVVAGIRWGSTIVSFEARDEPARSAFLRLVRSEPIRLDREEPGAYGPFRSDAQRYYWLMRCDPGLSWCFINVGLTPDRP